MIFIIKNNNYKLQTLQNKGKIISGIVITRSYCALYLRYSCIMYYTNIELFVINMTIKYL